MHDLCPIMLATNTIITDWVHIALTKLHFLISASLTDFLSKVEKSAHHLTHTIDVLRKMLGLEIDKSQIFVPLLESLEY